jgi:hypothetical protein
MDIEIYFLPYDCACENILLKQRVQEDFESFGRDRDVGGEFFEGDGLPEPIREFAQECQFVGFEFFEALGIVRHQDFFSEGSKDGVGFGVVEVCEELTDSLHQGWISADEMVDGLKHGYQLGGKILFFEEKSCEKRRSFFKGEFGEPAEIEHAGHGTEHSLFFFER